MDAMLCQSLCKPHMSKGVLHFEYQVLMAFAPAGDWAVTFVRFVKDVDVSKVRPLAEHCLHALEDITEGLLGQVRGDAPFLCLTCLRITRIFARTWPHELAATTTRRVVCLRLFFSTG